MSSFCYLLLFFVTFCYGLLPVAILGLLKASEGEPPSGGST